MKGRPRSLDDAKDIGRSRLGNFNSDHSEAPRSIACIEDSPCLRRFDAAVISDTRDLASQFSLPLMPFMLAGIFGDPALNLPDGFHPNAVGMRVLAASMWPYLEPLLQETSP